MAIFMNDPFSQKEDDKVEVLFLYNKNFQGVDIKYFINVLNFYKTSKSSKLESLLKGIVGDEKIFNLMLKEYTEDVDPKTGKINLYSVLDNGQTVASLRRSIDIIVANRDNINKLIYEIKMEDKKNG